MAYTAYDFIAKLIAVTEDLDAAQPVTELVFRNQLIEATAALCQSQGIVANAQEREAAVDRQRVVHVEPLASADLGTFSWRRPSSSAARLAETARLDQWPRHLLRVGAAEESGWNHLPWLIGFATSVVRLAMAADDGHMDWQAWIAGAFLLASSTLGLRDLIRRHYLTAVGILAPEVTLKWERWLVARTYVIECLAHSGELMERDRMEVERRILACETEIKKKAEQQKIKRQTEAMADWKT